MVTCRLHGSSRARLESSQGWSWPKRLERQPEFALQIRCRQCFFLFQRLASFASSHCSVLEGFEVVSPSSFTAVSQSGSAEDSGRTNNNNTNRLRLRLLCCRGHKFFISSSILEGNGEATALCPICRHQKLLKHSRKLLSWKKEAEVEAEAQETQRRLIQEARRSIWRHAFNSGMMSGGLGPPCMRNRSQPLMSSNQGGAGSNRRSFGDYSYRVERKANSSNGAGEQELLKRARHESERFEG